MSASQRLNDLIRINTTDMLDAFGLGEVQRGRKLLAAACYWPARRFGQTVLAFDRRVAAEGLHAAAAWALDEFSARLTVVNGERMPAAGPVLFLSNHPGITDTLALMAALTRPDLHIVAAVRPFLTSLDNMTRRLIYVDEQSSANLSVVRTVTHHLRRGGAVLTFPAGKIEPDPAVLPGAEASLEVWSDSIGLFARLAPATQVVPVLVSGVYNPRALHSPFTHIRRSQKDRERFAAMLQVIAPRVYPVQVTVALGRPFTAGDCLAPASSAGVKQAVAAEMRDLLGQRSVAHP